MPIAVATPVRVFSQAEFHAVDEKVMGIVFGVHNEFGRLLDEKLFKRALAYRCLKAGIEPVEQEVRIHVSHDSFAKDYYLDLLCAHGYLLEAKAVEAIIGAHKAQSLNYLLLAGLKHARLINMRPDRVEHHYVSTTLEAATRRQFQFIEQDWRELGSQSARLKQVLVELVADWGAFLEVVLYREALVHFLCGPLGANHAVDVRDGDHLLGQQSANLLTDELGFACTALTTGHASMAKHLRRFVTHTCLQAMQWVNFNHATIELTTITR